MGADWRPSLLAHYPSKLHLFSTSTPGCLPFSIVEYQTKTGNWWDLETFRPLRGFFRLKKPLRGRNVSRSHQFPVFVWYSTSFFLFWFSIVLLTLPILNVICQAGRAYPTASNAVASVWKLRSGRSRDMPCQRYLSHRVGLIFLLYQLSLPVVEHFLNVCREGNLLSAWKALLCAGQGLDGSERSFRIASELIPSVLYAASNTRQRFHGLFKLYNPKWGMGPGTIVSCFRFLRTSFLRLTLLRMYTLIVMLRELRGSESILRSGMPTVVGRRWTCRARQGCFVRATGEERGCIMKVAVRRRAHSSRRASPVSRGR